MNVRFKDYYDILCVARDADDATVKRAYRKLARKYHPDVNTSPEAEERFKEVTEAYEVLSNPEKRKRYDGLGRNWKDGQNFTPPPGWENVRFEFSGGDSGRHFSMGGFGEDSSDFFELLFGSRRASHCPFSAGSHRSARGRDHEASVTISLEKAYHGTTESIALRQREMPADGRVREGTRSYQVRIPPGTTEGTRIRLAKQGGTGSDGGEAGDLYLSVHIAPHADFRLSGHDLETNLLLAPWEAALGAKVDLKTLDGNATVTVPSGTQAGRRFRLRGKGLPLPGDMGRGDLYVTAKIVIPTQMSAKEKALFDELSRHSRFSPRGPR